MTPISVTGLPDPIQPPAPYPIERLTIAEKRHPHERVAQVSRRALYRQTGRQLLGEHAHGRRSPARTRFFVAHCDPLDVALTTVKIDGSGAVAWIDPRCDRNVLVSRVSEDDVEITEMNWVSVDANPHMIERTPARQYNRVLFNAISSFSSAN